MSVDTRNPLTLRLAAHLLGHGGVMTESAAAGYARGVRENTMQGRMPREMATDAMRPLVRDDVVVRIAGSWYAPSMADLAAWVADGFETLEDVGKPADPVIPGQRAAAA